MYFSEEKIDWKKVGKKNQKKGEKRYGKEGQ